MPDFSRFSVRGIHDVAQELGTDVRKGLTSRAAREGIHQHGPNEIAVKAVSAAELALRQFRSPFIYLLVVASIIAFALREWVDGVFIIIFVICNAGIGFYQEYKSLQTLKMLRRYVVRRTRVIRDGKESIIPSREITIGDLVIVEAGDIVPADLRIIEESDLAIDESPLTGESVAIRKQTAPLSAGSAALHEAHNIAFSGTTVMSGRGVGIVVASGRATVLGDISRLTSETIHISAFTKGLTRFSSAIVRIVMVTLAFIVVVNIVIKGAAVDIPELMIFAIALAVSVIPEALPVVTTFSLARGALKLARNHVVIKRLSSIEDLGSIDVLCTDKTGTLTENTLSVADMLAVGPEDVIVTAGIAASFLNDERKTPNNAFDIAVWHKMPDAERVRVRRFERLAELPFDPLRRRNSVLVRDAGQQKIIVRGAPEDVLPLCRDLNDSVAERVREWIAVVGRRGMRVLAVGVKQFNAGGAPRLESAHDEEGIKLVGCIAFADQLKKSTLSSIKKAAQLNVKIKMLTGDSPEVAGYIGQQIGLITNPADVITGSALEALSPADQFTAVEQNSVFARVSPQQKYLIIQLLQQKHEVGFLGEGINDAPALKIANVGLVVQGASDIAQDTADIVLLKKSLEVIIDGIHEGRTVFVNTVKYIKATLASNFGNFYAVAIASLFIDYLPMLPIQILLLNLLSDFPMIAIAADTTDATELKKPKQYDVKEIILVASVLGVVSTVFDFIIFGFFYRQGAAILQTNWFMASIITELAFLFSIRSRMPFFKAKAPAFVLIFLSFAALIITLVLPFVPSLRTLLHFVEPKLGDIFIIIVTVVVYFAVTEVVKHFYYRAARDLKQERPAVPLPHA